MTLSIFVSCFGFVWVFFWPLTFHLSEIPAPSPASPGISPSALFPPALQNEISGHLNTDWKKLMDFKCLEEDLERGEHSVDVGSF